MKMKHANLKNLLEKSVMVSMLFSLTLTLTSSCIFIDVFFSEKSDLSDAIFYSPYHLFFTLLLGILLILWITVGEGVNSKLWNWLPPFVFLKEFGKIGRSIIVFSLAIAILAGIISDLVDINVK